MFDNKEIAEKALKRIEQLNRVKKRRKHCAVAISTTLCISVAGLLLFTTPADSDNGTADTKSQIIYIEEPAVPLARPPTETKETCSVCGSEIEEQLNDDEHDKEADELCEQCKPPTPST